MRRVRLIVLAGWVGLAGVAACTREKPARETAGPPGAVAEAPPAPQIPVDVMPKVLTAAIDYPAEAKQRGEQGLVHVKALVGKDGRVTEVTVEPGQTVPPVLAQAAVAAVRQWTFEPGRSGGEPVAVWITVPVNFKLK